RGMGMKLRIGDCRLNERLTDAGMDLDELARRLRVKPARLRDYRDNARIMPLKTAASIAVTLGCDVLELYEWQADPETDAADGTAAASAAKAAYSSINSSK